MAAQTAAAKAVMTVAGRVGTLVVQKAEYWAERLADSMVALWVDRTAENSAVWTADQKAARTADCWVANWVAKTAVQMAAYWV